MSEKKVCNSTKKYVNNIKKYVTAYGVCQIKPDFSDGVVAEERVEASNKLVGHAADPHRG